MLHAMFSIYACVCDGRLLSWKENWAARDPAWLAASYAIEQADWNGEDEGRYGLLGSNLNLGRQSAAACDLEDVDEAEQPTDSKVVAMKLDVEILRNSLKWRDARRDKEDWKFYHRHPLADSNRCIRSQGNPDGQIVAKWKTRDTKI